MKSKHLLRTLIIIFIIGYTGLVFSSLDNSETLVSEATIIIPTDTKQEVLNSPDDFPEPHGACLSSGCHEGIEPIREHDSQMMQEIYSKGVELGDPNGCVVCHAGNPKTHKLEDAHKDMIRYPASPWVIDKTCGQCHSEYVYATERNLMMTEAGKIQGTLWGWKAQTGYDATFANYDVNDPDGPRPIFGTEVYKEYMLKLKEQFPNNFPDSMVQLPEVNFDSLHAHPEQAALTYIRGECQRCHTGVKGAQRRGDYRGMGCASCHVPYSDEGLYEGGDKALDKSKRGRMLVHSIQSSRKTKVTVHEKTYSGIPSETCTSCHNRGKRIGVSYLGIMESPYNTPFGKDGKPQPKLHGKYYNFIQDDVHHQIESRDGNPLGGLLCHDCHSTTSVHGNGNLAGTTLAEVEVECADCHGIPEKFPWELPLGYQDEFQMPTPQVARGTTMEPLRVTKKYGTIYDPKDGYLITARGNPLGNVVREGNKVIVHSASGLDFYSPTLKELTEEDSWKNPKEAKTAMVNIKGHIDNMECYTCHSTWAPQCYGCHVKVDYSQGFTSKDWIKTGSAHDSLGETYRTKNGDCIRQKGKVTEGRSYLRWENPILGVNGEGRITPLIPGCQQITTVIGEDGKELVSSKIWRTEPGMENGGEEGQRGIDMSPVNPHTTSAKPRTCASCHTDPKALGYGEDDGKYMNGYEKDGYVGMRTATGELIADDVQAQFQMIDDFPFDLSQIVTRDDKQIQTVGHHWPASNPLPKRTRDKMERVGTCMACHQDIPNGSMPISALTAAAEKLGMTPLTDKEHAALINRDINMAAWIQLLIPLIIVLILIIVFIRIRKKRKHRDRNSYQI